jgi:hypothetical protein
MLVPLIEGFYLRTRHPQEVEETGLVSRVEGGGGNTIKCLKRERGVEK